MDSSLEATAGPWPRREVILIAAVGPDRVIGDGERMPWKLPRDLRLFRRLTTGHAVVMGRRTFASMGARRLPKRHNVIVSRDTAFTAPGCAVAHSIDEALTIAEAVARRVFVIGGGEIYAQALPYATAIVLTEIFDENPNDSLFETFSGNVRFPALDPAQWHETRAGRRAYVASDRLGSGREQKRRGLQFRVRRFVRTDAAARGHVPGLTAREVGRHLASPLPRRGEGDDAQPDLFGGGGRR